MESQKYSSTKMDSSPAKMDSSPAKMDSSPAKMDSSPAKMTSSPTEMDSSLTRKHSSPIGMTSSPTKITSSSSAMNASPIASTTMMNVAPTNRNYLEVQGDGSSEAIAKSLFKKLGAQTKPNFHEVQKSPLFDKLESFMAEMKKDEEAFEKLTEEEKDELMIENSGSSDNVIEFNIVAAEDMQDSPVFKVLEAHAGLEKLTENDNYATIDQHIKLDGIRNFAEEFPTLLKETDDDSLSSSSRTSSSGDLEVSLKSEAEEDAGDSRPSSSSEVEAPPKKDLLVEVSTRKI